MELETDEDFKITRITMLKSRVENVHKLCEQIENFSRVIIYWKVPNGNSRKKVIVRKNKYEDPNRRLDITEKDKEAQRLSKWNYLEKKKSEKNEPEQSRPVEQHISV